MTTDQHASNSMAVREQALYADSGWRLAHGERFDVFDPTNDRVIASIPAGSEADVDEVLASAQRAQAGWARTPAARRGAYLREMADLIDANNERLAELVSEEVGKPLEQARGEVEFPGWSTSSFAEPVRPARRSSAHRWRRWCPSPVTPTPASA